MKMIHRAVFIITVIYLLNLNTSSAIQTINYLRSFPKESSYIAIGVRSFDRNDHFLYAHCQYSNNMYLKTSEKCRIYSEHYDITDQNSISTESCETTIGPRKYDRKIKANIAFDWLKYPILIITWIETSEEKLDEIIVNYKILNIQNCKVLKETEITAKDYKQFGLRTIPAKDNNYLFEVGFKNDSLCDGKVCKLKIGWDNDKLEPWFEPYRQDYYMNFFPFSTNDVDNQMIIAVELIETGPLRISLISEDGRRVLKDWKFNATIEVDISTNGEKIGVCLRKNYEETRLYCSLYDSNFKSLFETNLDFGYSPRSGAMFNLRDGGILLATGNCKEIYCDDPKDYFELKRIDSRGITSDTFKFDDFDCHKIELNGGVLLNLYQNKFGNHCLSRLCVSKTKIGFSVKCFNDDELKLPRIYQRSYT